MQGVVWPKGDEAILQRRAYGQQEPAVMKQSVSSVDNRLANLTALKQ
jgi:hypothetical protein